MIKKIFVLVDRLYWLWLILATPFLLFPSAKRSLILLVVPTTWVLHWILVRVDNRDAKRGSGVAAQGQQAGFSVTPLNMALLLLALMVLVSIWTTYDLMSSLGKITGIVLGFGVYFAVIRLCTRQRGFWISLGVFVFSGLVIAAGGLLGINWTSLTKIPVLVPIYAHLPPLISGLQGAESGFNPNEVAGTLVWILPLVLTLLVVSILRFRGVAATFGKGRVIINGIFCLVISLFSLSVLVLTQSRGAYIGFSFSVFFMIVAAFPRNRRLLYVTGLLLILAIAGVLVSAHWGEVKGWFSDGRSTEENSAFSEVSLQQRVVIWSNAIKGIQDFPFTGMGLNNFRKLEPVLYPSPDLRSERDLGHAHNEFLQVGVELGIPGLIAFISLYLSAFWLLGKTWRATFFLKPTPQGSEDTDQPAKPSQGILVNGILTQSVVLGLGGGLLAHFFYSLVDAVALGAKPGFVFWILLALTSSLFSLTRELNPSQVRKSTTLT